MRSRSEPGIRSTLATQFLDDYFLMNSELGIEGQSEELVVKSEAPNLCGKTRKLISHAYIMKRQYITTCIWSRSRPTGPRSLLLSEYGANRGWVELDLQSKFEAEKVATVLKVIGGSYYMVRFLGSYLELKVHKSDLRARQIWKDDQWFMAEKDLGKCEDAIFDKSTTLRSYQNSNYQMLVEDGYMKLHGDDNHSAQESYMLSSRKLKRVASDELSFTEPRWELHGR
ncbi:hypothetical protein Syun_012410 [Stephania yunnanensis]|uniref:Uncharacterized protein n=1 Tax=Stephania yunnanensis TaxID=152371 RepID=A0AAP0K1M4_9MAGN